MDDAELGAGKTCFVVSPIGNKMEPRGTELRQRYEDNLQMWADVLEPACETFGLNPVRADKVSDPGEITEQIFQYLRDAEVVIADLSGANANVMYELGLRHTRDLLTIQIGEYGHLPFDVNTIRTIQFRRTEAGLIEARNGLVNALRGGLQGRGSAVAATRIWNDAQAIVKPEEVARAIEESSKPDEDESLSVDEPGFIDLLAEGETGIHEVAKELADAASVMQEITERISQVTNDVEESDRRGKGFAGRLLITRRLAASLSDPCRKFEELANEYLESLNKTNVMVDYLMERMEREGDRSESFLNSLLGLTDAADTTNVQLATFLEQARNLRKISRELAPISKTIERSLNRYMKGNSTIIEWRPRAENLLADVPN